MRVAVLMLLLQGCVDSYGALSIEPSGGPPIGVGLTQRYVVDQVLCESGPDGDCGNSVYPASLDASATDPAIVRVANAHPFDGSNAGFDLVGLLAGNTSVEVTGNDGITITMAVSSADVVATTLVAQRPIDEQSSLTDVEGPVQAFVDTTLVIAQTSAGSDGSPRAGHAALVLDAGPTEVRGDPSCGDSWFLRGDCFATGTKTGMAQLSTPRGSLEVDVVDESAIATFAIADSPQTTLQVTTFEGAADLVVVPSDAAGRPIVGSGPPITVSVGDSRVVAYDQDGADAHEIHFATSDAITTTLDVTWGTVHNTYTLQITPFD